MKSRRRIVSVEETVEEQMETLRRRDTEDYYTIGYKKAHKEGG